MGELKIILFVLIVISLIAQIVLYLKSNKNSQGIFLINSILGLVIAFISYTALPDNDIIQKISVLILGGFSLIGLVPYYMKKNVTLSKLLISVSVLGGLLYLIIN